MSHPDAIPEADRLEGAPHPRESAKLIGQEAAEAGFLDAFNSGRLHHAWLITGPKGVGKATLAWRLARFLLATSPVEGGGLFGAPPPPATLDISPEHPVFRRTMALSEPGLFLLRRPWDEKAKRHKKEITVDEARKLKGFFSMSATDGGHRAVIIDSADEMNPSAANAVLKLLEEPPARTTLFLVSHQPSRLLPTIRSRCRTLRCRTLAPPELQQALEAAGTEMPESADALTALADGSVGAAHSLLNNDGLALYTALVRLFETAPIMDREMALAFAEKCGGRAGAGTAEQAFGMIDLFLTRLARTGALGPPKPEAARGEAALLSRLCPNVGAARHWATLHQSLGERSRHGLAVNLDPSALLLDTVLKINAGAGGVVPAPA
ncbi:DNA polymerase III subunit delta' [Aliiruegeria sabulilitoris]|uniref:DNA polymerase III subunit delta' n=1 Tax=Aliiruegeria sabulilitoris TaxID=1510458 RepID=UPI00082D487D|nr:DNA polymerase III subunit delta' [Aliiruegeria sabulilitoris]NDR58502.1 DNA polymerase III subunit delta' [Pseudoruegeria sp. M32A2M]